MPVGRGLPILESEEAVDHIDPGDDLEVDLDTGAIVNKTKGLTFKAQPIPPFMQDLIRDGGLMEHVMKKLGT